MKLQLAISIGLTVIAVIIGLVFFNIDREDAREYEVSAALPDFKHAVARKDVQFVYVDNGWGGAGLPVGILTQALCYGDISTKMIGPVGDFMVDLRLQFKAIDYAKSYNALVLEHLDSNNKNACLANEDWDGARKATEDYLFKYHNQNLMMPMNITLGHLLALGTIDDEAVITWVCEAFKKHGIKRSFVVSSSLGRFVCAAGTYKKIGGL